VSVKGWSRPKKFDETHKAAAIRAALEPGAATKAKAKARAKTKPKR
jgi:hypothetical protein